MIGGYGTIAKGCPFVHKGRNLQIRCHAEKSNSFEAAEINCPKKIYTARPVATVLVCACVLRGRKCRASTDGIYRYSYDSAYLVHLLRHARRCFVGQISQARVCVLPLYNPLVSNRARSFARIKPIFTYPKWNC